MYKTVFSLLLLLLPASSNDTVHLLPFVLESPDQKLFNPLPPGPSIITGTIVDQNGKPVKDAKITVRYPDKVQRTEDTFLSDSNGLFMARIFRSDQPYIDLEIKVGKKTHHSIRYENPAMGLNLGHPDNKIICKTKTKRCFLRFW